MIEKEIVNQNIEWIKVIDCRPNDKEILKNEYKITQEMLYYALDHHERPRIEVDESDMLLLIFDVAESTRFNGDISAEPIGIIIDGKRLFTFTANKTNFVNELMNHTIQKIQSKTIETFHPIDLTMRLLYNLSIQYFDYINQINSVRTSIQRNLKGKAKKNAISHLLNLQTNLVYFLTSLTANDDMLTDLKRKLRYELSEDQNETLEDIRVEIKQGLSMAEMANAATQQVANAYSNLLDSNLNATMKFLTVFSILLSVPNIIFGFFGQNVTLPFTHGHLAWAFTIFITFILMLLVILILQANDFFKK
ncbi:magnesium transporter CorA family protein [Lactobacillus sp. S2-2]|uniref:magnesium transporter CorA family protein n=1 Tax=Lactobacillus sp. S2-2 TaxID=2692917 RepID=UPI001F1CDC71|nr:magnesium transporter CorA family protein [Lactobacillus sp. S2-2]MCF6515259.1 magnesium transporter CorA family protein [Lactobacillus sp. S2-2]